MFCKKCGKVVSSGSKFCSDCGAYIGKYLCKKCKSVVDTEDNFCVDCGNQLRQIFVDVNSNITEDGILLGLENTIFDIQENIFNTDGFDSFSMMNFDSSETGVEDIFDSSDSIVEDNLNEDSDDEYSKESVYNDIGTNESDIDLFSGEEEI